MVMLPKRLELIAAIGFKYTKPKTIEEVYLTSDTLSALKQLERSVAVLGGQLKINSIYRSWSKQQELFDLHASDPKTYPVASAPGKSFHQAARAIDFDVKELNFPNIPKEKWLEKFWEISKPLGFTPIVDKPDLELSESWHFDHMSVWATVAKNVGYLLAAQCAILDIGNWNPKENENKAKQMFVQSQLIRLGHYEIGSIDGVLGNKCNQAIVSLGIVYKNIEDLIEKIKKL